jgi:hypothetical protein
MGNQDLAKYYSMRDGDELEVLFLRIVFSGKHVIRRGISGKTRTTTDSVPGGLDFPAMMVVYACSERSKPLIVRNEQEHNSRGETRHAKPLMEVKSGRSVSLCSFCCILRTTDSK